MELPEVARRHFKLQPATRIQLDVGADHITLRPEASQLEPEVRIEKRGNRMVITGAPPVSVEQIITAIAADHNERTDRILEFRRPL